MDNNLLIKRFSLSERDFKKLSDFIEGELGIKMPEAKKIMLESRLQKRLKALNLDSFRTYCEYLFSEEGQRNELFNMINIVTTNKTDFFREPNHFDFLFSYALPALEKSSISIWSAGCSTGEEPYTLAMVLSNFSEKVRRIDFSILATDISTEVLRIAENGIYPMERIEPVPMEYRHRYMLKSKDSKVNQIRLKPEIRSKIDFKRLNLMEKNFDLKRNFEIIFCRNVIIYFDKARQQDLLRRFFNYLKPGGFLFLGHSETMAGFNLGFNSVAPTVYQKPV